MDGWVHGRHQSFSTGAYLKDLLHGPHREPARPDVMQRAHHVADL